MPVDSPDIIQCSCGQKMRVPAESQSMVFKCVRCGALVDRGLTDQGASSAEEGPGESVESTPAAEDTLLDVFVEGGLISGEQARVARSEWVSDSEKVFETLLRLEFITQEQFHDFMTKESGTAVISLAHFTIDRHLTELLPADLVEKHWVLPIDKLGRSMTVAMVCPMDTEAIKTIEQYSGLRLRPMLCKMDEFQNSFHKHYKKNEEELSALPQRLAQKSPAAVDQVKPPVVTKKAPSRDMRDTLKNVELLSVQTRIMNMVDASVGMGAQGLRQIISAAQKSPPFAAKILCTANSRAYGIPGNVSSLPMAVALLGDEAVSLIALALPKYATADEAQWFPLNRFSRNVANIASVFAAACGRVVPSEAFCAGLLHGIGIYAIAEAVPQENKKIDPRLVGPGRLPLEEQLFGICHNEAGAILCRNWNIPESIRVSVSAYPDPGKAGDFRDLAELLFIATQLATPDGEINKGALGRCTEALKYLQIDPNNVVGLLEEHVSKSVSA